MDAAELADVGAKLVELGTELKAKREERDVLNDEIAKLEKKMAPLVAKHSELIAEIIGKPAAPPPGNPNAPPVPTNTPQRAGVELKRRIIAFLERAPEGTGAIDVADALKIDVMLVRQAMMDMAHASAAPVATPVQTNEAPTPSE